MLVTYESHPVEVEVIDYTRSATHYKQVARNEEFVLRHYADGTSSVSMPLYLDAYAANAEGGKGEVLPHVKRGDTLISDRSRAVDPTTGAMRYRQLTATTALNYATNAVEELPLLETGLGDWVGFLEAKEEPLMLQPFFIRQLFDAIIRPFCEQYIRDADAAPSRFA